MCMSHDCDRYTVEPGCLGASPSMMCYAFLNWKCELEGAVVDFGFSYGGIAP